MARGQLRADLERNATTKQRRPSPEAGGAAFVLKRETESDALGRLLEDPEVAQQVPQQHEHKHGSKTAAAKFLGSPSGGYAS